MIEMRRLDDRGWRQLHEPQVKLRDGNTTQWRVISNRAPRKQSDSDSPAKLGIDKKSPDKGAVIRREGGGRKWRGR